MNIRTLAAAAALGLVGGQASAAVLSSFSGSASLSLTSATGDLDGLIVTAEAPFVGFGAPFTIGNAAAKATDASGVYGDDAGTVAVSGFANAFGAPFGLAATGTAFADLFAFADNAGDGPVALMLTFAYDLVASVTGGGFAGDSGFADVFVSLAIDGLDPIEASATSFLGDGLVRVQGQELVSILISAADEFGPGFGPGVTLTIEGSADATSVAPVPLPAGLPLLAAGLGALALLRRRAA
jgi:hypothetical protein